MPTFSPSFANSLRRSLLRTAVTLAIVCYSSLLVVQTASAQVLPKYEGFQPLSQRSAPGLAARYAELAGKTGYMQPVRFVLDGDSSVSIFSGPQAKEVPLGTPAQVAVMVGHTYRIKVSDIPDLPAAEIFPTIELIDRLHPPAGQQDNFPIPVHITKEDIELAQAGNLVTRVVYVEQPQVAAPFELDRTTVTQNLQRMDNAITEADRRGRPIAIVRIGGRLPSPHGEHPSFFGSGGPLAKSSPSAPAPANQQANSKRTNSSNTSSARRSNSIRTTSAQQEGQP